MSTFYRRYFDSYTQQRLPEYMLAHQLETSPDFEINDETTLEQLWEEHQRLLPIFRELREKTNSKKRISFLELKRQIAHRIALKCRFCELKCGKNRKTSIGNCHAQETRISAFFTHEGDEEEIKPSLTIFFTGCNFGCIHCQNWPLKNGKAGKYTSPQKMAKLIISFIKKEPTLKNIHFLGGEPSLHIPYILDFLTCIVYLSILYPEVSKLPMVFDSNMYYTKETSLLLDGITDSMIADLKYGNNKCCKEISRRPRYMQIVGRNIKEAQNFCFLIVRHLALPHHIDCCLEPCTKWFAENMRNDVRYHITFQYHPDHLAKEVEELAKEIDETEREKATQIVQKYNIQSLSID
ncbi:pyruvate formate-lyase activating enzyme [Anaeramoeba ignava]|uniref:Pyruvate formate-lyase activating enzyme n=1 Tax=Anaeramoeba ignava TaxID=1746090 RepID=A0A9Q0RHJ4_ANAIG|nr:pyruvate formate-lyase activating enzyme [Anaeramoeba ignava]